MTRSEQLRNLRIRVGLSKARAARACDVSDRSYSRWETGEREPPEFAFRVLRSIKG